MHNPAATPAVGADLEALLQRLEHHLDALQSSLSTRDMPGIESHAAELQRALSQAAQRFTRAARRGDASLPLRRRLGLASAQVAAQRDALARASAALERAIDVLMPGAGSALYSPNGAPLHLRSAGSLQA